MPLHTQVKLLRVLEEREMTRVGGTEKIPLNVRIIAVTNKNLREKIDQKTFREDLYYRLAVLPIEFPPLRERQEDIPSLCSYFLENRENEKTISNEALSRLMDHDWPGNVRELKNVLIRACLLSEQTIRAGDIVYL